VPLPKISAYHRLSSPPLAKVTGDVERARYPIPFLQGRTRAHATASLADVQVKTAGNFSLSDTRLTAFLRAR